ncbi:hypothetical protein QE152_g26180 [Popillia japonica]|uniref:Uncharacterized protein n=1 Tax=Popillia japonica TaxID=7064 RepID=A0AAW1JZ59_POPJA
MLQNINTDIASAITAIDNIITYLRNYRSDESFIKLLETSTELANILEVHPEFAPLNDLPVGKKQQKRQFDYEHEDETSQNLRDLLKINIYNTLLDTTINALAERYKQLVRKI